jgi:PIN domain nuclease of toxin-antitoxin system
MKLLLDTHVLLWWSSDSKRLSAGQRRALGRVAADKPALVSDISLWEIATLEELGRIRLQLPLREWLERATAAPLVQRCDISPLVAATVAKLSPSFHRDPVDRILVATALVHQATLVTSDERILEARIVPTLD